MTRRKTTDDEARRAGKHIRKPIAPHGRVIEPRRRKLRDKASANDWTGGEADE